MKRSTNRILTTHTGSLARPAELLDAMSAIEQGKPYDQNAYAARLRDAVAEIVCKQAECGLDVIDDGEMGKPSFLTYINQRLGGFEPGKAGPGGSPWASILRTCLIPLP